MIMIFKFLKQGTLTPSHHNIMIQLGLLCLLTLFFFSLHKIFFFTYKYHLNHDSVIVQCCVCACVSYLNVGKILGFI
ncbi:hypothetical protein RIR_jg12689.t1 [Rhizophagus irregularis DAOM 181602=DAOM 197198]|nr:hypothetical protein RIR_jg12689.t1 [Rhizophagus irregularis DAOM 181602=DAOM 197198]